MSGQDSKYFSTTKNGEIPELKEEINSQYNDKRKDAVKKVIAATTVGKDVSLLFTDVVNSMQTENLELKKLVYFYLINYAKSQPDLAILAVNTFVKTYNEVQRCFLTVGSMYPEDLFSFLLNKCRLKEEPLAFGALCVLKHLLPRSSEAWHNKRPLLVDVVKSLLDEQSLGIRKALSEGR